MLQGFTGELVSGIEGDFSKRDVNNCDTAKLVLHTPVSLAWER